MQTELKASNNMCIKACDQQVHGPVHACNSAFCGPGVCRELDLSCKMLSTSTFSCTCWCLLLNLVSFITCFKTPMDPKNSPTSFSVVSSGKPVM